MPIGLRVFLIIISCLIFGFLVSEHPDDLDPKFVFIILFGYSTILSYINRDESEKEIEKLKKEIEELKKK